MANTRPPSSRWRGWIGIGLCLLIWPAPARAQPSVQRGVTAAAGGAASAGPYTVVDTTGQPAAGSASSQTYAVNAGFWGTFGSPPMPSAPVLTTLSNQPVQLPVATLLAGSDADGDAVSLVSVASSSAQGGVVVLAAGLVTYTPPNAFLGADSFTYTIIDTGGDTAVGAVSVNVLPQGSIGAPPTLTSEPQGGTLGSGDNATLTVTASGSGTLFYQWQFNGANIAGATGSRLSLDSLQLTNAGLYSVMVSNGAGTVISAVVVLNVAPRLSVQLTNRSVLLSWPGPFVLQAAGQVDGPYLDIAAAGSPYLESTTTNGQRYYRLRSVPFTLAATNIGGAGFRLAGAGIPGLNFVVEGSTNLVSWQPLQTNSSPFTFTDTNTGNHPLRFYRAVLAH